MLALRRFAFACTLLAACRDGSVIPDGLVPDDLSVPQDLVVGRDMAQNPGPKPLGGHVTTAGGSVDRLFFGFTGDTRPSEMDDTPGYPTSTITNIFTRLASADVQFTVDLGDHMYVVNQGDQAVVQMGLYTTAAQVLGARPLFMVLGNHDCNIGNCYYANNLDSNFNAYMAALKPTSPLPYYSFTIGTHSGTAVFVVVSDNYTGDEFNWLEKTLADCDAHARYTIIMRHHPLGYNSVTTLNTEATIKKHRYSLLLTGHAHHYERDANDPKGRTLIYGLGGVPNSGPAYPNGMDWGYGTVQQGLDDRLYVTIYSQATGMPLDSWSVDP